jgi:3',5'-cyclic AMP phosphodiesterase CpdA
MRPVHIIHFSDVHVYVSRPGWRLGDYFSKHLTGWLNWNLTSRGKRFADALPRIQQIARIVEEIRPDGVVFSGDASAIGFPLESAVVADALKLDAIPRIAVPGNHDHYTKSALKRAGFEKAFAKWQQGQRIDATRYPFATQIGETRFIGVNTACPNWIVWDAHGCADHSQLARLDQLLKQLPPGPRVLVTHYPYAKADGEPEHRWHGLRDRSLLSEIAIRHGVRVWLCGHRHRPFVLSPTKDFPIAMICAGSATQQGPASFSELRIEGQQIIVTRWKNDPVEKRYRPNEPFIVNLNVPVSARNTL